MQWTSSQTKEKLENTEMKENEDTPHHNNGMQLKQGLQSNIAINAYIKNKNYKNTQDQYLLWLQI